MFIAKTSLLIAYVHISGDTANRIALPVAADGSYALVPAVHISTLRNEIVAARESRNALTKFDLKAGDPPINPNTFVAIKFIIVNRGYCAYVLCVCERERERERATIRYPGRVRHA